MGRHSKEGDSQPLTAGTSGRHRTPRSTRSVSLISLFRRSRHRPRTAPNPNVFHHEGADAAWSGTLAGIAATTKPGMRPVPKPEPVRPLYRHPGLAREFVEALMPAPSPTRLDLVPSAHLDPPTHYRRFVGGFQPPTITVDVSPFPARS